MDLLDRYDRGVEGPKVRVTATVSRDVVTEARGVTDNLSDFIDDAMRQALKRRGRHTRHC
jgi:transposase InsO family protein